MYVIQLKKIKKYLTWGLLTILIAAGIMFTVFQNRQKEVNAALRIKYDVLIDAGHGGLDGGAVSANNTVEAPINLAISTKVRDLLGFLGINGLMVRPDEQSLDYNPESTVHQNKVADLKARLALSNSFPDCAFLSIHLNKFTQSKYSGAQVFYSENNEKSPILASCLQKSFQKVIDAENVRQVKPAKDVYLMDEIQAPAVTIECGFISNEREEALLKTASYQCKLALAISAGYLDFLME